MAQTQERAQELTLEEFIHVVITTEDYEEPADAYEDFIGIVTDEFEFEVIMEAKEDEESGDIDYEIGKFRGLNEDCGVLMEIRAETVLGKNLYYHCKDMTEANEIAEDFKQSVA